MSVYQGELVGGEVRHGKFGFFCANGRKHVFHHVFSEGSGTNMDIGPCEGESCPLGRTHGLNNCGGCESGSCLVSRRITLDRKHRDHDTSIHPSGKKRGRREYGIVTVKGGLTPDWYYQLALDAEASDGLTSDWPDDWQKRKCEASELGHNWIYKDDSGAHICRDASGRGHMHRDGDEPEHIANATQRQCTHCPAKQTKRPNGEWSDDRDGCLCCAELPAEHSQYYCIRCGHETAASDSAATLPEH